MALLLTPVYFAAAASPRVYISAVSPSKSGYAVDEAVTLTGKIKWEDLTANKTINIQLWNSTDMLESLENYTTPVNVSGVITEDGSYTGSWSPTSELTEDTGSKTYYLKIFGTDGIEIDSEAVIILVAQADITISVIWQDQNNDRLAAINEGIVWTIYTNWNFVETTESHGLYVDWGTGTELLLDTISVTAGSGSDTSVATKGFDTAGAKSIIFRLKDATGSVVKTQTVSLNVGSGASTQTTPTAQSAGIIAQATEIWSAYWQIIVIAGAAVVIGYVLYKGKGKKKGK